MRNMFFGIVLMNKLEVKSQLKKMSIILKKLG